MDRDRLSKIGEGEAIRIYEQARKSSEIRHCLYPDCTRSGVNAHTIQRGGLKAIAFEGHVLQSTLSISDLLKGRMFRRIGIARASTFKGFCADHDSQIFSPLEDRGLQPDLEQAFLLGYRAFCYELFAKIRALGLASASRQLDRGLGSEEQEVIQTRGAAHELGSLLGLQDLLALKAIYDRVLLSGGDFSCVRSYVIRFDRVTEIACVGATNPDYDFLGAKIQDLAAETLDQIAFSLIPSRNSEGLAVFTWLAPGPACDALIRSLEKLPIEDVPHAIFRFIIACFENTYYSPPWLDGIGEDNQKRIIQVRVNEAGPQPVRPDRLRNDELRLVNWKVRSQEWLGP